MLVLVTIPPLLAKFEVEVSCVKDCLDVLFVEVFGLFGIPPENFV